jgi:hypothetical protein
MASETSKSKPPVAPSDQPQGWVVEWELPQPELANPDAEETKSPLPPPKTSSGQAARDEGYKPD